MSTINILHLNVKKCTNTLRFTKLKSRKRDKYGDKYGAIYTKCNQLLC